MLKKLLSSLASYVPDFSTLDFGFKEPPRPIDKEVALFSEVTGAVDKHDPVTIALVKAKAERRAKRHFDGIPVRHRVVDKKDNTIQFAFFRRSGHKKVLVRWTRVA